MCETHCHQQLLVSGLWVLGPLDNAHHMHKHMLCTIIVRCVFMMFAVLLYFCCLSVVSYTYKYIAGTAMSIGVPTIFGLTFLEVHLTVTDP